MKYYLTRRVVIIGLSGLAICALPKIVDGSSLRAVDLCAWLGEESALGQFSVELGAKIVAAAILALAVERILHEATIRIVKKTLEAQTPLVESARSQGVEELLTRRGAGAQRWHDAVAKSVAAQLATRMGSLRIACVAAPELLRVGTQVGDALVAFARDPSNRCRLRVAFLNPASVACRQRAECEAPHATREHIRATSEFVEHLRALAEQSGDRGRIEVHSMDAHPAAFLVITDSVVFSESYCQGDSGGQPLGGRLPVLKCAADSVSYERWARDFEFTWTAMSKDYFRARVSRRRSPNRRPATRVEHSASVAVRAPLPRPSATKPSIEAGISRNETLS